MLGGRSSILPIRKIDSGKFVDLDSAHTIGKEFESYAGLTAKLLLQLVSATFFVLLDRILYELLEIIARHSRIDYVQEGVHNLNITVLGSGFVAKLIRESIDGFNVDEQIRGEGTLRRRRRQLS